METNSYENDSFVENCGAGSFNSFYLHDSDDDHFHENEGHDPAHHRTTIFQKGINKVQNALNPNKDLKQNKLKHRHFEWLYTTSAMLWYSTLLLIFLEFLQRELDASYSPGLTKLNKMIYGNSTESKSSEKSMILEPVYSSNSLTINRTPEFIYKNVQPNCWADFLKHDRFTENWSVYQRQHSVNQLNSLFNEEFPDQTISYSEFRHLKYETEEWYKMYPETERSPTFRFFENELVSDRVLASYIRSMITIGVLIQAGLVWCYHCANCNLWLLHHGFSYNTSISEAKELNKAFVPVIVIILLHWPGIINHHFPTWITQDYKDFLRTMIFFRYPIIWCFRCRESQLSRKIRLTADMQVIKLFWLKQRVRNHPGKLIIKITTMLILAFSYFLYSEERDGGYCRKFSIQFWTISGAITGSGLDPGYQNTSYKPISQFIVWCSAIIGLVFMGLILSTINDLAHIPMMAGELEIERERCMETMRNGAAMFMQVAWRKFIVRKEIKELIEVNNDLVEQQNRIMIMNLHGTDAELEDIEEREMEFLMKIEVLLGHLDWLALQITKMSIGRSGLGGNNTGLININTLLQAKKGEDSNETEDEDQVNKEKGTPSITTKNSIRNKMGNTSTQEISDFGGIEEHTNKRKFSTNNLKSAKRVSLVSIKDHNKNNPRTLSILSHTTKKSSGWNKVKNNSQISAKLGKVPKAASIMSQSGLKNIKDIEMQKKSTSGNDKNGILQVRIEEMQKKVNMVFGQHVTRWRELRIATDKLLDKINQDLDKTKTAKNTKEMMEKLEKLETRRKSKEKQADEGSVDQFERGGNSRKVGLDTSKASRMSRMSLVSKMSQMDYK